MFSARSYVRWAGPLAVGLIALGVGPLGATGVAAAAPAAPVGDDFNGDGYQDLAVAASHATIDGKSGAGYVAVMYGGPHGLSASGRTIISRATKGIPGSPAKNENFGTPSAKGDLDGDGYADLVVGPVIVWGGPHGLSGGTSLPGGSGGTVTSGDFDGDGRLDLALFRITGAGGGDDPGNSTGAVWHGPFSRSGTPVRTTTLDPEKLRGIEVSSGASGDVNGDGRDDLVVDGYGGDGNFGSKFFLGSPEGLVYSGTAAPGGGRAVALGDVNGDGYDDIVAGREAMDEIEVAYGSASGIGHSETWKTFTQDTPGVPGAYEENDAFGASVAVGDITGDGIDDVAVGAPGESLGETGRQEAGVVTVLRGSRSGLTGTGAQAITEDSPGIPGAAEAGDRFGSSVRLLDINGNGYADLSSAAWNEDKSNGAVWELRGRPTGIVPDAAFVFGGKKLGAPYAKAEFGARIK
ncbi:FG-GAP and VCBS repeat-containing protein [Streptomyces sp. NPDC059837]|uniref:FG-GAP and VCBS repeat-containing protein n=1 Tax=Streptomyces sp. NPDC059837 TaxID=3346968 RepID=UPI00364FEA0B